MTMDGAIVTKGLTKIYGNNLVVNGLDLMVPQGSVYGFLGLNGAGKTTTIKMLLNLVYPTSGEGKVLGHDLVKETVKVKEKVGYVADTPFRAFSLYYQMIGLSIYNGEAFPFVPFLVLVTVTAVIYKLAEKKFVHYDF